VVAVFVEEMAARLEATVQEQGVKGRRRGDPSRFPTVRDWLEGLVALPEGERNPFRAKLVAKANADRRAVTPCSQQDIENMERVLRLKLEQHSGLREQLLATGDEEIVEDCTSRPHGNALFWGAALRDGAWTGENRLGRLWMKLREELAGADGRGRPRRDARASSFD
jgi:hypothetical protein